MGAPWRNDVACMMRVRNEARWIKRSLERTWAVAKRVVILDDGSADLTFERCLMSLGWAVDDVVPPFNWRVFHGETEDGACELHYIRSPFRPAHARPHQEVSEIRDKNFLWEYCKANVPFQHMLCLDGDEMLSLAALRNFPSAVALLVRSIDVLNIPFIYVWDREDQRRVDGIYGPQQGFPHLNFPRLFTISRAAEEVLFDMRFAWEGTKGGFHCGSVPRERFLVNGQAPVGAQTDLPIVHFGYLDEGERQRKLKFYRSIDPNNLFEGNYAHIVGEPDQHAPGPVELVPWEDV